jgi:Mg2+/citrate symporter
VGLVKEYPIKVTIGIALLTILVPLDGDGTATFMNIVSAHTQFLKNLYL